MDADQTIRVVLLHRIDQNSHPNDWSLRRSDSTCRSGETSPKTSLSNGVPSGTPASCLLRQSNGRVFFVGKYRSGLKETSFSAWSVFQELVRQALALERTNKPLCIYAPKKVQARTVSADRADCDSNTNAGSEEISSQNVRSGLPIANGSSKSAGVTLLRSLSELLSQNEATVLQVAVSTSPVRRRVMRDLESAFGIPLPPRPTPDARRAAGDTSTAGSVRSQNRSTLLPPVAVQAFTWPATIEGAKTRNLSATPGVNASGVQRESVESCGVSCGDISSTCPDPNTGSKNCPSVSLVPTDSCKPSEKEASKPAVTSSKEGKIEEPRLVAQEAHRALMGLQTLTTTMTNVKDNSLRIGRRCTSETKPLSTACKENISFGRSMSETEDLVGSRTYRPAGGMMKDKSVHSESTDSESRVEVTVDYRSKSTRSLLHRRSFRSRKVQRRSVSDLTTIRTTNVLNSTPAAPAVSFPAKVVVREKSGKLPQTTVPERRWSSYVERPSTLESPTSPLHRPFPPTGLRVRATPSESGCADLTWDPAVSGDGPTKVLGYEVYLNGELEATVEGGDACSAPLVELVDGKAYTITVKSRGLTEDSSSSKLCRYTHRSTPSSTLSSVAAAAAAAATSVANTVETACRTPSSDPPSRPLSSASVNSHNSVFGALRLRSKTISSASRGSPQPASDTMAVLQKELRSILTLSVDGSDEQVGTPPKFGRTSSSSSSSSGISAGSWSSSPMHEGTSHRGLVAQRSPSTGTTTHRKSSANTPAGSISSAPPAVPLDELKQVLHKRASSTFPKPHAKSVASPMSITTALRQPLPVLPTASCCSELSPLSLDWDDTYDTYLSPAEVLPPPAVADKVCKKEEHQGSWV